MVHKSVESDERPVRRRDPDGDSTYVYMRAEDRSIFMKLSYLKDKYSIIWGILFWLALAVGFDFKTPAKAQTELKQHVDSAIAKVQQQVDTLQKHQHENELDRALLLDKVNIMLRLRCVDAGTSDRDKLLAGLDCSKIPSSTP